jgi:hypothetical protein
MIARPDLTIESPHSFIHIFCRLSLAVVTRGVQIMKRFLVAASAIASFALAGAPAQAASLLVNGGFEAPAISTFYQNFASGSTGITGWTVDAFTPSGGSGGNVDIVNGNYTPGGPSPAAGGAQFLDLVGFGTVGSIYQTFSTVAGQSYTVSFAYSHNLFGGDPSASAISGIYGPGFSAASYNLLQPFQAFSHNSGSASNLDWLTYSFNFVASGTEATLAFGNLSGGGNAGVLLDNVSVSGPVPEPATWVMMIAGFGLVGATLRRRSRVLVQA